MNGGILGHVPVTDDRAEGLRLAFLAALLAGALLGLELDESELQNKKKVIITFFYLYLLYIRKHRVCPGHLRTIN